MQNTTIAGLFSRLADLLELDGANPFRTRAYRSAARTIETLPEAVADLAEEGTSALTELPGIGKDLAAKIVAMVETGRLTQLEELERKFPPDVVRMLNLPNVGPKKVAALHRELGVRTIEDLKAAGEAGHIAELSGFGKKTQENILANLDRIADDERRFHVSVARGAADAVVEHMRALPSISRVDVAGSCRRWKETIGDLDVLAISDDSAAAMDHLAAFPEVTDVLARGETKQRVRLASGIELDLRVVPEESFGAALMYFTGSKEHNIVLRQRARDRDLKLNEYGLYRGDVSVAGSTEEEVYAALDLPWFPPELREDRHEFAAAETGELPDLVEIADIRGDLHMHTTATDGTASIRNMAEAARERGLEYIAITDHSKRVSMANGLNAKRLREHWREIDRVNAEIDGIEVLKGIECDILEDATMDLSDDVLSEADWVVAVLHYGLQQPRETITARLLCAIENPYVCAIGHPTGRMVLRRPGADVDFETIFDAAAEHGVMMEINAHPSRLDLDDVHAAAARDRGIPIVIDTDSHSVDGFDVLTYGVHQARRAGLTKAEVANTRPLDEFRAMLRTAR